MGGGGRGEGGGRGGGEGRENETGTQCGWCRTCLALSAACSAGAPDATPAAAATFVHACVESDAQMSQL
jgi:hypothetical protein